MQPKPSNQTERAEPVLQAVLEIDTAGAGEIANRDGNVAEPEAEVDRLDQKLGVENEVVGVALKRNALEDGAAINTEATVKIAQILTQREILHSSQKPVAEVLVQRHPAL